MAMVIGLLNFGLVIFVLLCYANNRSVKYWAFFPGNNNILRLIQKSQKNIKNFGISKILRKIFSRNPIQKGYHIVLYFQKCSLVFKRKWVAMSILHYFLDNYSLVGAWKQNFQVFSRCSQSF